MKTEWRIFGVVGLFLYVVSAIYAGWTYGTSDHVEWIGVLALALAGSLCLMCGGFFWFVSRRIELRPEDRSDGEIADGAGEIGFFSPGSYWPMGVAAAATFLGIGLAFWLWWMIVGGIVTIIFAAAGLLFEYYSGTRRTAEH